VPPPAAAVRVGPASAATKGAIPDPGGGVSGGYPEPSGGAGAPGCEEEAYPECEDEAYPECEDGA